MRGRQLGALSVGLLAVVLAGAPGTPPSSTLALLSDQAVVAGAAQAAVLSLDVRVDGADGQPVSPPALENGAGGDVEVTVAGELRWELSVQLLPADGEPGCAGQAGAVDGVVVDVAAGPGVVSVVECAQAQVVGAGHGPGAHRVAVVAAGGDGREDVVGLLRIRVAQVPGGFSDVVDVPVRLVAEAGRADEVGRSAADDQGAPAGEEPVGGGGSSPPPAPPVGGSSPPAAPRVGGASPGVEAAPGSGAAPGAATPPPPAPEEPVAAEPPVGGATPPPPGPDDADEELPAGTETSATEEPSPDPAT